MTLPTCTAQGYTTHTCSRCRDRYQDSYTVALGHDWKAPSWSWTGDYSTASATFVCSRDAAHRQTLNAAVSSVRTEPSWAADGEITYTAIVTFGGHTYSDSKTVILPKPRTRSATMRDSTARTVAVTVNLDTAQVRTNGAAAMSAPVLVAAYDEKGRFKGVEFVTATIAEADTPDGTAAIEIMWIDGSAKPKAEAVDTDLLE